MRFRLAILTLLTALTGASFAQGASAYVEGQVIVRFGKHVSRTEAQQLLDPLRFSLERELVPALNIQLVKLTPQLSVLDAIEELKGYSIVVWSQADHYLSQRSTFPNDALFGSQWDMNQASDSDIDAPEAWDVSTGGTDQAGNDIVVAVIDGGCLLTHPDLQGNLWTNPNEIPGNAIDDDTNGYVDDINGWDAYDENGTLPVHNHGTHVAGTVGARGNNASMVSGVNWNVKLMIVAGSSSQTSVVSIAYNYVLTQKTLWWQTNGLRGANVVATNSSFGVDNASCTSGSYPIWNDLYNAMGEQGILSAAATANNAVDVDAVGDVPTQCTSPYLVTVTNTTNADLKNSGSAWGQTSIDLGAPGTSILSTTSDGATGYSTGTSMATPHVAGAIALMHAAASTVFNDYYHLYPDSAALALRELLLASVDTISALTSITVTWGRLNLHKAVNEISQYSGSNGALPNLRYVSSVVADTVFADADGLFERGETVTLEVAILNTAANATNVAGTLSESDPYLSLIDNSGAWPEIDKDSTRSNTADYFVLQADSATPLDHVATLTLALTADSGYTVNRSFALIIGRRTIYWADSVRDGTNGWTHDNYTNGFVDQWHISTELSASPDSAWKCGNSSTGTYSDSLDAGLISPPIVITPQSIFTFDSWIDAESSTLYQDSAYDGGFVEISTNGGPFAIVTPSGGYGRTFRYERGSGNPYTGPLPGVPCYSGSTSWLSKTIDLSGFAGDSVRFRFRFCSDSSTQREGWYLDNFAISGEEPVPVAPLAVDDLVIQIIGNDALLAWTEPDPTITGYVIYRSADSEFVPSSADSIGFTFGLQYTDVGIAASDSLNFYFIKSIK
ncbi:S8 family serine peptidase [candidate division KSB1 bacterium]|nr:S8 family serine peptidase [candidate division KSB1 bacterium]